MWTLLAQPGMKRLDRRLDLVQPRLQSGLSSRQRRNEHEGVPVQRAEEAVLQQEYGNCCGCRAGPSAGHKAISCQLNSQIICLETAQ